MVTAAELLDLAPSIGQRASSVRFDVLDSALTLIGTTAPVEPSAKVTLNINRSIKRDLSGLFLDPAEQEQLDPFGDRLRPMWVLETGEEYALGVFVLGSMDRLRQEWGLDARASAVDQTIILDQPITESVGLGQGADIRGAIIQQLHDAEVPSYSVDLGIATTVAEPIVWPIGTSRLKVVNELAAMAGAFSVYFDNDGVGIVELATDATDGVPDHVYASGGRIIAGSMVESDDLLESPNRYLVVDTSAAESPVFGYFDVPASAPHSFANRGFRVVTVIQEQGLTSSGEATVRAYAAYLQDSSVYEWVQFSSPPDPRHDTFDVVEYLGVRYREQGWSLPLSEGGEMTHDLRRAYSL